MIMGPLKGGLGSHLFWAHNPPPFATYYFFQTTVSIAGPLKKVIARAHHIPAMDCGHRSCDLGWGFMINNSNMPSLDQWIRSSFSESTTEICFTIRALDFSNLKPPFSSISFTWSEGSSDAWLLLIDDWDAFRVSGLRENQITNLAYLLCFLLGTFCVFYSELSIYWCTSASINDSNPASRLWPLKPDWQFFCSLHDQWSRATSGLRDFPPFSFLWSSRSGAACPFELVD